MDRSDGKPLGPGLALAAMTAAGVGLTQAPVARVYGAGPIKRMLQRHGRSQRGRDGTYTPHNGEREIARRLRQAERDAERQIACVGDFVKWGVNPLPPGATGLSRRGRWLYV
jgi:hypothetical protein